MVYDDPENPARLVRAGGISNMHVRAVLMAACRGRSMLKGNSANALKCLNN